MIIVIIILALFFLTKAGGGTVSTQGTLTVTPGNAPTNMPVVSLPVSPIDNSPVSSLAIVASTLVATPPVIRPVSTLRVVSETAITGSVGRQTSVPENGGTFFPASFAALYRMAGGKVPSTN